MNAMKQTHLGHEGNGKRGIAVAVVDLQVGRRVGSIGGVAHNEKEQLSE